MKAYKHLVDYALKAGHKISVWDGEEWQVSKSTLEPKIIEAVESVEVAQLRIVDADGKEQGWALVIPFGLEDDETVADMTMTPFMLAWDELYTGKPLEL
jgi:hypothetical protein